MRSTAQQVVTSDIGTNRGRNPPSRIHSATPPEQVNDAVDTVLRLYKDVVDGVKSVPLLPPSRYLRS